MKVISSVYNLNINRFRYSVSNKEIITYPLCINDKDDTIPLFGFKHCLNEFLRFTGAQIEQITSKFKLLVTTLDESSILKMKKEIGEKISCKCLLVPKGYKSNIFQNILHMLPIIDFKDEIVLKIKIADYIKCMLPLMSFLQEIL